MAGANLGNVVYLRTYRDVLAIREILSSEKHVVIVGSGYLGAEAASSLLQSGCKLTLLSRDKAIWQELLDPQTADWLTNRFQRCWCPAIAERELERIRGQDCRADVQTKSGLRFPAGLAFVAIGTEPNL